MENVSHICLEKNFISIIDNNTVLVYDTNTNLVIQTYTFKDEKIKKCILKVDSENKEIVYLLISDNKGSIHLINVNKNEKVHKYKVHDDEVENFKVSKLKNLVYSIERNGILKISDFLIRQTESTIKLAESNLQNFDLDKYDQNIVFSTKLKIKMLNIPKNVITKFCNLSSELHQLSYSCDGKFIVASNKRDYFIYIWHRKNNSNPLITLQLNSQINHTIMKFIEKGVYHVFSYNKSNIYGYNLILGDINPQFPIKPSIEISLSEKNLINISPIIQENLNNPHSIFLLYGTSSNNSKILTKIIKYSKTSKNFKDGVINVNSNITNSKNLKMNAVNINQNSVLVLNEIQMNNVDTELGSNTEKEELNQVIPVNDEKISLINVIQNAIINNDNLAFEWALKQKDLNVINSTVMKMQPKMINGLINKLVETFQSNAVMSNELLKWVEILFKHHLIEIAQLPKSTQTNLNKIQTLIRNRTNNLDRLIEVSTKLDNLINHFESKNKQVNKSAIETYEPLLVYYESDSEEDTKMEINKKMEKNGIVKMDKKTTRKIQEEDVEMMDASPNDFDDQFEDDLSVEDDLQEQKDFEMEDDKEDNEFDNEDD